MVGDTGFGSSSLAPTSPDGMSTSGCCYFPHVVELVARDKATPPGQAVIMASRRHRELMFAERSIDTVFGLGGFVDHDAGRSRGSAMAAGEDDAIQWRYLRVSDAVRS